MYISSEDDDFGELGSPVSHSGSKVPKLMTEKPEHFRRSDPTRKASTGTSSPRKRGKTLINFILESDNGDSGLNSNDKNNCKKKRPSPIIIENVLTVRIKNINTETTDSAVHSKCTSYGPLNGLVRRQDDAVDVLFRVKDSSEAKSILRRLNGTKFDGRQWSAHVLAKDETASEAMNNIEDANCKLMLQMSDRFAELKRQMNMKKVYSEDLAILHHALLHLECQPATISK